MTEFYLSTKGGEVINTTRCNNLDEAIDYFAVIKNLKKEDLLSIFEVK